MSWHYSRALEEASSRAGCSDGARFVLSSLTNTRERSSSLDKTTGTSSRSRSGMTSGRSTVSRGEALSTSSRAASRVRTSASLEKETASTESGPAYGGRWLASFAKFDPDSRSWKTLQLSLVEDSTSFSETWPRSGTMRNGESWERPTLALLIGGKESGSSRIPTPTAGDAKSSGSRNTATSRAHPGVSLTDYVRGDGGAGRAMLPTPTSTPYGTRNNGRRGDGSTYRTAGAPSLDTMARRGLWPTPTAQDAANNGGPSQYERNSPPLNAVAGGALSPTWVEWLMGWPLEWTALDVSAMDRYLKRRRRHSSRSRGGEDGSNETA